MLKICFLKTNFQKIISINGKLIKLIIVGPAKFMLAQNFHEKIDFHLPFVEEDSILLKQTRSQ